METIPTFAMPDAADPVLAVLADPLFQSAVTRGALPHPLLLPWEGNAYAADDARALSFALAPAAHETVPLPPRVIIGPRFAAGSQENRIVCLVHALIYARDAPRFNALNRLRVGIPTDRSTPIMRNATHLLLTLPKKAHAEIEAFKLLPELERRRIEEELETGQTFRIRKELPDEMRCFLIATAFALWCSDIAHLFQPLSPSLSTLCAREALMMRAFRDRECTTLLRRKKVRTALESLEQQRTIEEHIESVFLLLSRCLGAKKMIIARE